MAFYWLTSLVSDNTAGDGKIANRFLKCTLSTYKDRFPTSDQQLPFI